MLGLWCEKVPGDKPVRILETGASPYGCGGERGQWNFLKAVLAFSSSTRGVTGITIVSLTDQQDAFGLLAADGRRRVSWHGLRSVLKPSSGPPR
jgi:hypothetical protein